jgi:hypothetical protein
MKKKRAEGSKSPYVKKDKAPYVYSFKNCGHKTVVYQSTPTWSGKVCSICNIIVRASDN